MSRGNSLEGTKVKSQSQSNRAKVARRGSIPLILLIVLVLGIGASASLFLTQGTQRVGKHEELTQKAWFYAQSAVEEVLVKITNGAVIGNLTENRVQIPVAATQFMGVQNGVVVSNPMVHFRMLENPSDSARMQDFMELMTVGPGYGSAAVRASANGGDANVWWQDYLADTAPATHFAKLGTFVRLMDRPDYEAAVGIDVPGVACAANEICKPSGKGRDFVSTHWEGDYRDRAPDATDNPDEAEAFEALLRLPANLPAGVPALADADPYDGLPQRTNFTTVPPTAMDPVQMRAALVTGSVPGASPALNAFLRQFNVVMDEMADEVDDRFAGCGDDVAYAVGAYVSGLVLGKSPDNNQDEEEEHTEAGRDSGALQYSANLVTVQAQATAYALNKFEEDVDPQNPPLALGTLKTSQPVTAHRIVSKMSLDVPLNILREQEVVYLTHTFRLTPLDMAILGWITVNKGGVALTPQELAAETSADFWNGVGADEVTIVVSPIIHLELFERWDNPGAKVVPFQAATCLSKNALG
jgi:hypothetical protein